VTSAHVVTEVVGGQTLQTWYCFQECLFPCADDLFAVSLDDLGD
jgi:hypothetical protein